MDALIRYTALFFLLLAGCACQPSLKAPEGADPVVAQARSCADSARALVAQLKLRYDSLAPVNEFEALKVKNNYYMILETLSDLEARIDSARVITDKKELAIALQPQTEYMRALMASGRAILSNNSQSFGEWEK